MSRQEERILQELGYMPSEIDKVTSEDVSLFNKFDRQQEEQAIDFVLSQVGENTYRQ